MGWLHGAMLTRQPYTLSVYVHALDRRRERQRLKLAYRRLFAINRGAEQRGRVPDFDRYAQEREYQQLLGEMAGQRPRQPVRGLDLPGAPRAAGPTPTSPRWRRRSTTAPSRSSPPATARSTAASSASASCGRARCRSAATSRAAGAQVRRPQRRRHASRWSAPACGSPTGIPFAFADPGRTRRAAEPLRRGARQPHAADLRAQRRRARR